MPMICVYIEEYIWNSNVWEIGVQNVLLNYTLLLLVEIALLLILNHPTVVYIGMLWFAWFYGLVNYYVLEFKGNVPTANDLLAVGTAINVASSYSYGLDFAIVAATMVCFALSDVLLFFPLKLSRSGSRKVRLSFLLFGVLDCILVGVLFFYCNMNAQFQITINAWDSTSSVREYGAYISLVSELQNMKLEKPDGYSVQNVEHILADYEQDVSDQIDLSSAPSVIVIMNESFSDLRVLGSFESDDFLEYFNGMTDYVMKGYVYTSAYGGGTCNSEFEFLTGNSTANLNAGVFPYQRYNLSNCSNLAAIFGNLGYETIAIHPAKAQNWNRAAVYYLFGFDDFLSIEDMIDVEYLGSKVSDAYDYKQLIQAYEERESPVFLFNVTIQNHGGYYSPLDTTNVSYVEIEEQYQQYEDVINYLTLVSASDAAFEELIEYFSNQTDPVIICMFGDHQPSLDSAFIDSLLSDSEQENPSECQYITPYVIWSNYDTGVASEAKDMSVNYLGAQVLQLAGIENAYSDYLLDLETQMPIINIAGYQTGDGTWHLLSEESDVINEYKAVQYYEMMEQK
jgi:phosphoglycerol transferase MdoB-like AlkP superfamily enzyme